MKLVLVSLLLCVAGAMAARPDSDMILSQNIIDEVNLAQKGWEAGKNIYFAEWDIATTKGSMGVKRDPTRVLPRKIHTSEIVQAVPDSFDSRTQWPGCIGPVLNQGSCGSCWAFGAAEAASDRMCIETNGTFVQLAPLDLTTCDSNDNGCEGGDLGSAWSYINTNGLVTEPCYPYGTAEGGPISTCAPADQPCLPPFINTPPCTQQCSNNATWANDKHYVASVYGLSGATQMQAEIYQNGPIEAAFDVYEDFVHYKSGVYTHTTGDLLGGHAIKIIGWGTENSTPYWLVQNSWTTTWGNQGYFKIALGTDECGIEDDAVAGTFSA